MNKKHIRFLVSLLALGAFFNVNAQWQNTNGLVGKRVNALTHSEAYLFAATSDSGVFRSSDDGTSWLSVNTNLANLDVRALAIRGTYIFAGTFGGGVYRSGDNGESWQAMNTGISTLNIQALGGNNSFLFAGTSGGGVCRYSDNTQQWLEVSNGLVHINVFSIGISSEYVFVGTWGGSAFRTADNGENWFLVTNGLFDPRENIIPYSFAVADTFIFAGTGGGGVFRGKDSARVWFPFNTGLPDAAFVTALALIEDTLFAATDSGVYRSIATNNSIDNLNNANWVADNDGLADTIVLSFAKSGNTLFAGTDGGGVWRRSLTEIPLPAKVKTVSNDNDTVVTDSAICLWHRSNPYITSYHFQGCADKLCTQVVSTDSTITDTAFVLTNLSSDETYWWRVRAHNAAGWGPFSNVQKIIVDMPSTAQHTATFASSIFDVEHSIGSFRYSLPEQCHVSLVAYDIKGRTIRKYVSSQQSSGHYTVNIDRNNMAAGPVYLLLKAGNYSRLVSVLLID